MKWEKVVLMIGIGSFLLISACSSEKSSEEHQNHDGYAKPTPTPEI